MLPSSIKIHKNYVGKNFLLYSLYYISRISIMNLFFVCFLFIFGTLFWSFSSVLIYRLRNKESGILTGRSHCTTCQRNLSPLELIPIISWTLQKGRCRGCKQKISAIYPLLELTMGILFAWVGYFLINSSLIFSGNIPEIIRLWFFLSIMFLTVIYVFYDILYLEIPESILAVANILAFGALGIQSAGLVNFFPWIVSENASHLLWLQISISIIILWGLYTIMRAEMKEIWDVLLLIGLWIFLSAGYSFISLWIVSADWIWNFSSPLLSGTFAALSVFSFLFLQIVVSQGRWMGAGDLRIWILLWLLCWIYFVLPGMLACYISGSIIGIALVFIARYTHPESENPHQIPFGPFLALGYISILLFSHQIENLIHWYLK